MKQIKFTEHSWTYELLDYFDYFHIIFITSFLFTHICPFCHACLTFTCRPFRTKSVKESCFFFPFRMLWKWVWQISLSSLDAWPVATFSGYFYSMNCETHRSCSLYLNFATISKQKDHLLICWGTTVLGNLRIVKKGTLSEYRNRTKHFSNWGY